MKNNKNKKSGQSLIEYIAITALVAIVSISAVKLFGSKVQRRLAQISGKFDNTIKLSLKSSATKNLIGDGDDGDYDGDDNDGNNSNGWGIIKRRL